MVTQRQATHQLNTPQNMSASPDINRFDATDGQGIDSEPAEVNRGIGEVDTVPRHGMAAPYGSQVGRQTADAPTANWCRNVPDCLGEHDSRTQASVPATGYAASNGAV